MTTAMTNVKNVEKLNEKELQLNLSGTPQSWHYQYRNSAWIFVGGLSNRLTEGDVITVFSQYGEVVNINLVRDKITGTSKGFCFLCYEDQRSTILAVENLNNIKIDNRTLRVDHVEDYKIPDFKESQAQIDLKRELQLRGCAPDVVDEIRELEKKKRELEAQLKQAEDEDVDLIPREKSRSHSDSHSKFNARHNKQRDSNNSPPRRQSSERKSDRDRSFKTEKTFHNRDSNHDSFPSRNKKNFEYNRKRSFSGSAPTSKFQKSNNPRYNMTKSYRPTFASKPQQRFHRSSWPSNHHNMQSSSSSSHNNKRANVPKVGDYREIIERYRASLAHRSASSKESKFRYNNKRTTRS